jgi:hypothetical protein
MVSVELDVGNQIIVGVVRDHNLYSSSARFA